MNRFTLTKLILELLESNKFKPENSIIFYLKETKGLSDEQVKSAKIILEGLQRLRKNKKESYDKKLVEYLETRGIEPETVNQVWDKTKEKSVQFYPNKKIDSEQMLVKAVTEIVKSIPSIYNPKQTQITNKEENILIFAPSDIHIGKISEQTNQEYVDKLINKSNLLIEAAAKIGYEKAVLVIGNDILHVDNFNGTTTKGTFVYPNDTLDVLAKHAIELYTAIIHKLADYSPVEVVFVPSNHDYVSGFFIAKILEALFSNTSSLSFNVTIKARKYLKYGRNLFMFEHGDKRYNFEKLPAILLAEASQMMEDIVRIQVYTAHIHHKKIIELDICKINIESLRSTSDTDLYHEDNGWLSLKCIQCFIHRKQGGEIHRLSDYLD